MARNGRLRRSIGILTHFFWMTSRLAIHSRQRAPYPLLRDCDAEDQPSHSFAVEWIFEPGEAWAESGRPLIRIGYFFMIEQNLSASRASFSHIAAGTQKDWQIILREFVPFANALPDRILAHLRLLDGDFGGFPVDRLTHSLQTATRAYRDERNEEYVVCALLHDIGVTLCSYNHADLAAAILKPFVSEANHWMVQHHGIFQGYFFTP